MKTEIKANKKTALERLMSRVRASAMGQLFLDKKFVRYTYVGIFISVLNIFLLWLLIDIIGIPTVISSTLVIGATFILRYLIFRLLGIM